MGSIIKILSMLIQFTLVMLVPTVGLFFLGMFLDNLLGTSFLSMIFFFVGAAGGMCGVYKLVRSYFKDDNQ